MCCSTNPPRLLDTFADLVQAAPDEVVLQDGHPAAPASPVTRRELEALAANMAEDLRRLGIGEGDCIAVWLPNWSQAVAVQFAAIAVGAHVIGINTRYNVDEVAHVLQMAQPRAVVIAHGFMDLDLVALFRGAMQAVALPAPTALVVTAPGSAPAAEVLDYDLGSGAATFPLALTGAALRSTTPSGLAVAFTTSGSTGKSKLAAHDEAGLTSHVLAVGTRIGLGVGDVMLGALPLSGVFGFSAAMASIFAGASVLLEPVFDARDVLGDMVRHRVTHVVGADDLLGRIANAWQAERPRLPLKWIGIADFEGRSKELAAWAENEFGATVAGVYGSSEVFALAAFWPSDYEPEQRWTGGGRVVMPSILVRVVDPVDGSVLAEGQEGEIQLIGPNVVNAYLGDPGIAAHAFTSDGWFRSGDLGRLVAPDTFQFVCRMSDVLRLRGFLVDPAEIESRLAAHPAVALTKVVGVTGSEGGTIAVAFVVANHPDRPDEDELRQWCAQSLARFKVPTHIHMIDEMPTTSGTNGTKIRADVLRDLAAKRVTAP